MEVIFSIALIILVIAVTTDILLAYVVYRSDSKSATNRIFIFLSIALPPWLAAMYIGTNPAFATIGLLVSRATLFLATPVNVAFFLFAHTFPGSLICLSKKHLIFLFALAALVMVVGLSPYAFTAAETINGVQRVVAGPGLLLFGLVSVGLNIGAIYFFAKKYRQAIGEEREQIRLVVWGITIMFGLIIATIFVPVLLFQDTRFVILAPLYVAVFLAVTAYAIVRHQLFNLKVIATRALTVVLSIVLFSRLVVAQSFNEQVIAAFVFVVAVILGVLLARSVQREVEQREKLEALAKQLQEANTKLEDLSRFKTQLLSIASHQIRSPLAAIKGFASLLLDGSYGPLGGPKISETIEKLRHSANELIDLINNLLDLRKVEEGRMDYQMAKTDLGEIVGATVDSLRSLATNKKLEFTYMKPPTPLFVNADAQKLQQVIQNLIDNSIKYTPTGFVHVELFEKDNAGVMFSVSDSGLGMPAELIPHLFEEEFVRDERVKKEILGTGLGLYIAKKIIEAHGGKIWAESKGQGKGATFFVALQRAV